MRRRLLSLLLAAVMLTALLPAAVFQADAEPAPTAAAQAHEIHKETKPATEEEKDQARQEALLLREARSEEAKLALEKGRGAYPVLTLNTETELTFNEENDYTVTMQFTPTVTRWYQFISSGYLNTWCDVYCEIYSEEYDEFYWSEIVYDDNGGKYDNFGARMQLSAGVTYYFAIGAYSDSEFYGHPCPVLLTEYELPTSGSCGLDLTWRFDKATGKLSIDGSGPMDEWNWNNSPWSFFRNEIKSLSFSDAVTKITSDAFADCNNLESVVLPSQLRYLGDWAFAWCSNLKQIEIPADVTYLGSQAFYGCTSLTEIRVAEANQNYMSRDGVLFDKSGSQLLQYPGAKAGAYTVPAGVSSIDSYAFYNCWALTAVTIPDSVTDIGYGAFGCCSQLESVRLPADLKVLPEECFYYCESLRQIDLPAQLERISYEAFCGSRLTSVTIPESVTRIENEAFAWCRLTEVTLPRSVTYLGNYAFNIEYLNAVYILNPACEFESDGWMFGDPEDTTVYGAAGSTAQGYAEAFDYAFEAIDLCEYGSHAYELESQQEHTETEDGWKRWVCQDCGAEYTETVPAGHVFTCTGYSDLWYGTMQCAYCSAFYEGDLSVELTPGQAQNVVLTQAAPYAWLRFTPTKTCEYWFESFCNGWDPYCALYQSDDTEPFYSDDDGGVGVNFGMRATLEAGTTYYYRAQLLSYSEDFESVQYQVMLSEFMPVTSGVCGPDLTWRFDPDTGVLTIDGSGWMDDFAWGSTPWNYYQYMIQEVVLPDGLKNIGQCAFGGCYRLTHVTLPPDLLSIGYFAFESCESLEKVVFPAKLKQIDRYAFSYCYGLKSVTMQKALEKIGGFAFYTCPALTDVTVPAGVREIGRSAFGYNYGYDESQDLWTTIKAEDFKIRGFSGSEAELYADWFEFEFISLQEFADVTPSKWYYDAVIWAVSHDPQITSGADETHFAPNATCTRCQVMTFLWHAENDPAPASEESPFTDVTPSKWYYKSVLWAVENGITSGIGEGLFGPNQACTRAAVVTFLWKAAGAPEPETTESPFTDVTPSKWYYKSVLWAVENGITSGIGDGLFGPNQTCTRAQIVTFLFKADQIK